jgi:hypothetical protein
MTYKNPIPNVNSPISDSSDWELSTCECCSKPNLLIHATPYTGSYCKACLKLVILECKEALSTIEEYEKSKKIVKGTTKHRISKTEHDESRRKKDEALERLFSGDFTTVRK